MRVVRLATRITPSQLTVMIQPLSALIFEGESKTMEFKTSFHKASVESLVVFANMQGGMVLVGAGDGGKVQGLVEFRGAAKIGGSHSMAGKPASSGENHYK